MGRNFYKYDKWTWIRPAVFLLFCLQVRSEFSLKTHAKLDTMVKGINQIIPLAQGTMTGLAIRYVMNSAFVTEEGDRPKVRQSPSQTCSLSLKCSCMASCVNGSRDQNSGNLYPQFTTSSPRNISERTPEWLHYE